MFDILRHSRPGFADVTRVYALVRVQLGEGLPFSLIVNGFMVLENLLECWVRIIQDQFPLYLVGEFPFGKRY